MWVLVRRCDHAMRAPPAPAPDSGGAGDSGRNAARLCGCRVPQRRAHWKTTGATGYARSDNPFSPPNAFLEMHR